MLITYGAYAYNIRYNVDLTLLSIAIIFPLVFSIRGSFRRREKALEHLSEFKSSLHTVKYYLLSKPELTEKHGEEVNSLLLDINHKVLEHLKSHESTMKAADLSMNQIYNFILANPETISRQIREKVFRFMKDVHESVENLNAIHIHRTPISMKAYCLIFIYIFPFIYAPEIIKSVGDNQPQWIIYGVVFITQFILISLYNIQNHLEYPFDSVGIDDINLENFKLDR